MYMAVLSDLPDVTGDMLDFWFYWYLNSSKYRMWNPNAHPYAWTRPKDVPKDELRRLAYKERDWDTTLFVNEYISNDQSKLSLGVFDPRKYGYALTTPESESAIETILTAFVEPGRYTDIRPQARASRGPQGFGASQITFMHQLRKKPDGSGRQEMRLRFWICHLLISGMTVMGTDPNQFGHDTVVHCHIEMTHLGKILPGIFEEFKDDIW